MKEVFDAAETEGQVPDSFVCGVFKGVVHCGATTVWLLLLVVMVEVEILG